ncbi:MAG: PH domain-containing protein [Planctomycetota bacterium]
MDDAAIRRIERPHPNLLVAYFLQALGTLLGFPFVMLPLYFKYHTLRYKFDDEGISASWGIIFHREIYLTYRRIQDIHVSRNLFERWLGIGKVALQTAAGSSSAELTLEGMEHYEAVRDYLYGRMRGTAGTPRDGAAAAPAGAAAGAPEAGGEAVALLRAIRADIEGVRRALEGRQAEG